MWLVECNIHIIIYFTQTSYVIIRQYNTINKYSIESVSLYHSTNILNSFMVYRYSTRLDFRITYGQKTII